MYFKTSNVTIQVYVFKKGFNAQNEQYATKGVSLLHSIFNFIVSRHSITEMDGDLLIIVE